MTPDSDAGQQSPQPNVRYDDFVARVNPDPATARGGTVLAGFIGKGAAAGDVRIYADHSLTSWVDVPADAVLHSVEHPTDTSPLGGSTVWVKHGARLTPGSAVPAFGAGQPPGPVLPTTTVFPTHPLQGCPPPHSLGIACTLIGCTQVGCVHPTATAVPTNVGCQTAATVCTQVGCVHPTATAVPTNVGCQTAATVCTQVGCVHPTATAVPTNVGCMTQAVGCEHTGFVGICGLGATFQPSVACRQGTFTPFGGG